MPTETRSRPGPTVRLTPSAMLLPRSFSTVSAFHLKLRVSCCGCAPPVASPNRDEDRERADVLASLLRHGQAVEGDHHAHGHLAAAVRMRDPGLGHEVDAEVVRQRFAEVLRENLIRHLPLRTHRRLGDGRAR